MDAFKNTLKGRTSVVPDDTDVDLIVFIAGHGHSDGKGTGFICWPDENDPTTSRIIKYKTLYEDIVKGCGVKADHILFVIDTCHTGRAVKTYDGKKRKFNWSFSNKEPRAYHALGSCADDEEALEIGNVGLFTKYFLEAIDPKADFRSGKGAFRPGNQEATACEVFLKISDKIADAALARNRSQNLRYGSIVDPYDPKDGVMHDGQFVFYRPALEAERSSFTVSSSNASICISSSIGT